MDIFSSTKDHKKHFTVTGYVINKEKSKMLLVHHNKLNKWLPAGGHLEQNEIPHEGAIREVFEETGIKARISNDNDNNLELSGLKEAQLPRPFALCYQVIPESSKDVEHIHLDMVFKLEANETDAIIVQNSEVKNVAWFTKQQIMNEIETFKSVINFAKTQLY